MSKRPNGGWSSREPRNAYMREYMRQYRRSQRHVRDREPPLLPSPTRNYESVTAAIMGDPPIGRRALDAKLPEGK